MLKAFFGYRLEDIDNPLYSHLLRWNNSNHIKKHFSQNVKSSLNGYSDLDLITERLPENFSSWDLLAKSQWLETTIFMSGYLLSSQGDRMSMANSVEGRYPFLDFRIIEFCNSLNSDLKLKGLREKYLLKKLLRNKIPESIINRAKQPYRAPVKNVFLSDNSPEYVNEMLSETFIKKTGLFNFDSVNSILSRIKKTGTSSEMDDMLISIIISTHLLFNQFIENKNNSFNLPKLNNLRVIKDV
jgi:asparagine synthase (glutamine-hydrolysing)